MCLFTGGDGYLWSHVLFGEGVVTSGTRSLRQGWVLTPWTWDLRVDIHPPPRHGTWGGTHLSPPPPTWDTTGCGRQASGTHSTGMLSCITCEEGFYRLCLNLACSTPARWDSERWTSSCLRRENPSPQAAQLNGNFRRWIVWMCSCREKRTVWIFFRDRAFSRNALSGISPDIPVWEFRWCHHWVLNPGYFWAYLLLHLLNTLTTSRQPC